MRIAHAHAGAKKNNIERTRSIHLVKAACSKHTNFIPAFTKLTNQSGHDSQINEEQHDSYVYCSHFGS
eukprot:1710936-Heterocapsa_arctica.AAC.1